MIPLKENAILPVDLGNDGTVESLYACVYNDEDGYGQKIEVRMSRSGDYENYTLAEGIFSDYIGYYVRANGQDYLLIRALEGGDLSNIEVFSLSYDGVTKLSETGYDLLATGYVATPEDYLIYGYGTFEPGSIPLEVRTDLLGTAFVYSFFKLDDSGEFQRTHEYYYFRAPVYEYDVLTLKQPLECTIYDFELGKPGESVVVPVGTELYKIMTDNEDKVILSEDVTGGRTGYIVEVITDDDYDMTVNGVDPREIFEGVGYAG